MSSVAHRKRIGAELRRLRQSLGLSGEYVAGELGWSQSKVSRIESARFTYDMVDLAVLLEYYDVPEEVRAELTSAMTEGSGHPGAWIVQAGGSPRRQGEVAAIESRVARMRQYHPVVVPGQLQSRDYTCALATAAGFENADEIADRRMQRQRLMVGDDAPEYNVLLDARALCRWPGDKSVLHSQLDHLLYRASIPSITLRVIPLGGNASLMASSPFLIYDFRSGSGPTVVLVESRTADLYMSGGQDIELYADHFEKLSGDAFAPGESLEYLKSLVKDLTRVE